MAYTRAFRMMRDELPAAAIMMKSISSNFLSFKIMHLKNEPDHFLVIAGLATAPVIGGNAKNPRQKVDIPENRAGFGCVGGGKRRVLTFHEGDDKRKGSNFNCLWWGRGMAENAMLRFTTWPDLRPIRAETAVGLGPIANFPATGVRTPKTAQPRI